MQDICLRLSTGVQISSYDGTGTHTSMRTKLSVKQIVERLNYYYDMNIVENNELFDLTAPTEFSLPADLSTIPVSYCITSLRSMSL